MSHYLSGAERRTESCRHLNREESALVAARRDALSYAFDDDDDASGILEHHLPMASFQSKVTDGTQFLDEKRAAAGFVPALVSSDACKLTAKLAPTPEMVAASHGHTDEGDQPNDSGEPKKSETTQSPSREIKAAGHHLSQGETTRNNSQPGAFRAGGVGIPSEVLQIQVSEGSMLPSVERSCARQSEPEILVNAELVSNGDNVATLLKGVLVQASSLDVIDATPDSVLEFMRRNRKVQLCIVGAVTLVAAMVISLITTIGYNPQISMMPSPTTSPTTMQTKLILDILTPKLTPVSLTKLDDSDSPQSKALRWLSDDVDLTFYTEERILQRYALATFFHATGGPSTWIAREGWLSDDHECSWFSSSSDPSKVCRNGTLVHLNMMGNALGGTLPEEIALLTDLVEMTVEVNAIVGNIPAAGLRKLSGLKTLRLTANLLSGTIPTEIGLLSLLTAFHVANNGLEGTLPSEIGSLTLALEINTFQNFLNGTLPSELGQLTKVKKFVSWGNALSGSIPTEVGNMLSLAEFSLHTNELDGSLPTELGKLDKIEIFELQRNHFTGIMHSELGNMRLLSYLNVGDNHFTGPFPVQVTAATNLAFLSLYNNSLSGTIPTSVGMCLHLQEFYVDNNLLSGTIPSELGLVKGLQNFWAGDNDLTGTVPPEVCNLQAVGETTLVLPAAQQCDGMRDISSIRRRCPRRDYPESIGERF